MNTNANLDARLEALVAARYADITTLEAQDSDALDFHEVSVWGLKALLVAAYEMGREDATH